MKKRMIGLLLSLSLLGMVFAGCTSTSSEKVVTYKGGSITQEDLYKEMKATYGSSVLQTMVINKVLNSEYGSKVSEDTLEEKYQEWVTDYGDEDTLLSMLEYNGYTEETFKENYLKSNLLLEAAVKANLEITDELLTTEWENSLNFDIIAVSSEDTAKELITKINDGEDFATLATENSSDTSAADGGSVGWYNTSTGYTYGDAVITALKAMKDGEVSSAPVNVDDTTYYILKMNVNPATTSKKMTDYKDELTEIITTTYLSDSTYITELITKILKDANVTIKDSDLQDALSAYTESTTATSDSAVSSSSSTSTSSSTTTETSSETAATSSDE